MSFLLKKNTSPTTNKKISHVVVGWTWKPGVNRKIQKRGRKRGKVGVGYMCGPWSSTNESTDQRERERGGGGTGGKTQQEKATCWALRQLIKAGGPTPSIPPIQQTETGLDKRQKEREKERKFPAQIAQASARWRTMGPVDFPFYYSSVNLDTFIFVPTGDTGLVNNHRHEKKRVTTEAGRGRGEVRKRRRNPPPPPLGV